MVLFSETRQSRGYSLATSTLHPPWLVHLKAKEVLRRDRSAAGLWFPTPLGKECARITEHENSVDNGGVKSPPRLYPRAAPRTGNSWLLYPFLPALSPPELGIEPEDFSQSAVVHTSLVHM